MYDLTLTTSHVLAQSDIEAREITIGTLLREVASARSFCSLSTSFAAIRWAGSGMRSRRISQRCTKSQTWKAPSLTRKGRTNMSPQKTPNVWVQVEDFPLTGSGKIQKFILRDRFVAGEFTEL
ncbi:hypothetical protein [Pseudohalocynthiibacter sp. F2068]|uniref:hypothetical protein n=1 Tax=Pseudohalocynthiibacter sp. F2068 TaxID=2926418 RepID=UPI001FF1BF7A|nr:hypothetical protein [Pseudohalocynthiibacter sp. F2068]MCK0104180.1 hypothetical protein [Pseudohalocynthiibacter sp. F2068]